MQVILFTFYESFLDVEKAFERRDVFNIFIYVYIYMPKSKSDHLLRCYMEMPCLRSDGNIPLVFLY